MEGIGTALGNGSTALTLILIVVGLAVALVLLFWIFRKIAGIGGIGSGRNKQPRLAVLDAAHVDGKRRLVLVRRDEVEHLVLIGGASDVLIEGNIDPATVPVRQKEHRSRRRSREDKVEATERQENTDVGLGAAGVGAGAAAIAANQYADQAESQPVDEAAPSVVEQALFEPENDETLQETITEEFATPADTFVEPDLGQAPPPSSVLEEELESALQTDEQEPDPFSELESELATVTPELESLDDTPAPVEPDPVTMDPPLSEEMPEDLPDDLVETAQVEITESIAAELSVDEPLAPEVEVDSEPEQQSDKAQKQPLSKNQNVEDEMQRLLDELANS